MDKVGIDVSRMAIDRNVNPHGSNPLSYENACPTTGLDDVGEKVVEGSLDGRKETSTTNTI